MIPLFLGVFVCGDHIRYRNEIVIILTIIQSTEKKHCTLVRRRGKRTKKNRPQTITIMILSYQFTHRTLCVSFFIWNILNLFWIKLTQLRPTTIIIIIIVFISTTHIYCNPQMTTIFKSFVVFFFNFLRERRNKCVLLKFVIKNV